MGRARDGSGDWDWRWVSRKDPKMLLKVKKKLTLVLNTLD